MNFLKAIILAALSNAVIACSGSTASNTDATSTTPASDTPRDKTTFNSDSAYAFVKAQTDMGPRVPGTEAHRRCGQWMADKLQAFGADTVINQRATIKDFNGASLDIHNVIARFNSDAKRRVLLLSHWDSRPWADEDADPANHTKAIDGANDGASGVAVLLELARTLKDSGITVGVDILMTDAEDGGISAPDGADQATAQRYEDSWCLGTQYFVKHMPYADGQRPAYAILLDMVGGRDARFPVEYFSYQSAPELTRRWVETARQAGYGDRFPGEIAGAITDDHIHLINAGIPSLDIIEIGHPETGSFNPTWHTMADNLSNIDRATMAMVGQVLTAMLKAEK